MQTEKSKKRKRRIVFLTVLAVVVVIFGGAAILAYRQANNIKAVQMMKYTPEEQQALKIQNENTVQEILEKLPVESLKPLDEEQEEMLQSGTLSEEEALDIIMGKSPEASGNEEAPSADANASAPDAAPSVPTSATTKPVESTLTAAPTEAPQKQETSTLQEKIARVYLLRSSFTGQLDSLIAEAKEEYYATPSNMRDTVAIGRKYLGRGQALEKQCDAQMETLLADVKTELERTGGDTSVVSQMRAAYKEQKSIKKAELLSRYLNN